MARDIVQAGPNACIFCGTKAPHAKISKEHVVRAALRKHLPAQGAGVGVMQRYREGGNGQLVNRKFHLQDAFDLKVNCVCKRCNEGWLEAKVEVPAEPLVKALLQGSRILLSKEDSKMVATWAAKTAAVRAYMDKPPRTIPEEHYRHLMCELEPPPGTCVWLGHTADGDARLSRHIRWGVAGEVLRTLHLTTLHYGHMALFVVGISQAASGLHPLAPTISRIDSSPTLRLWPNPASAIWPNATLSSADVMALSAPLLPPGSDFDLMRVA